MSRVIISEALGLAYYVVFKAASRSIIQAILHIDKDVERVDIPRDIKLNLKTFSCVRNPFDRLVSLHAYLCQELDEHEEHKKITKEKILGELKIEPGNFEDLCKAVCSINPYKANVHHRPQYVSMPNSGVRILLKFEELEQQWEDMVDKFGLPRLQHKNPTQHDPYDTYFTEQTKKLVREYYKKDFERFGYG